VTGVQTCALPIYVYNKKILRGATEYLIRDLPETDIEWYRGVEASTVLVKRSVYEKFGLYDEDLKWKIDREMWFRLLSQKCQKIFIDQHVSIYRKHSKQISQDRIRKQPAKVNAMFEIVTKKRSVSLNRNNTIMLSHYNPRQYISEVIGVL